MEFIHKTGSPKYKFHEVSEWHATESERSLSNYPLHGIYHLSHTTAQKKNINNQSHIKRIRRTRILGNFWIVKLLVHFRRIWHLEHVWKTQN
jgi:hypothetical protein